MNETTELAVKLESLLPEAMRLLFRPSENDPLADLPVAQLRMMRQLFSGRDTPSEVGEALGLSVSAVTQIINRMTQAGLVTRTEDPDDRRVRRLGLSDKGLTMMMARHARRVAAAEDALEAMSHSERVTVVEAMELLVAACAARVQPRSKPSLAFAAELEQTLPPTQFMDRL